MHSDPPELTVVVPAYNEETVLPKLLGLIADSAAGVNGGVHVVVVDNRSTDRTAAIAHEHGVEVVVEQGVGISHARNAGARGRTGVLVFIDADATFPPELLPRIQSVMRDPGCAGGAADARYDPKRLLVRWYLGLWRLLGKALKMSQGAVQLCRADVFAAVGGYDTRYLMGEDVDFIWRVRRYARQNQMTVENPLPVAVTQSSRRFDRWPLWRTLLWTNPIFISFLRTRRSAWTGWYDDPPREHN